MQHIVATFTPDKTYTRYSEGSFLRMKDGGIYFAFSRFTGSDHDDAPSDIVAIRSYDEGETWSEPEVVIPASSYNTSNVMSVSMLRMQNGDMGLIHGVKIPPNGECYLNLSNDEGKTFYTRIRCSLPDRPCYFVLNNDRVIRLQSGRLLMPITNHRGGSNPDDSVYFDGRGVACFLYSDDDGRTWKESADTVSAFFTNSGAGLQENGAVEKLNGVVWGYSRTDMGYHYEYFSMDNGNHWTSAQMSRFTAPCSPLQMKRNPFNGDLYAVWNPIPNYNGRKISKAGWGRTPIVWAVSKDDGITWSDCHVIESDEERGYCYPAVFFTDEKNMLVAYCSGGAEDGCCLAKQTIMKISL